MLGNYFAFAFQKYGCLILFENYFAFGVQKYGCLMFQEIILLSVFKNNFLTRLGIYIGFILLGNYYFPAYLIQKQEIYLEQGKQLTPLLFSYFLSLTLLSHSCSAFSLSLYKTKAEVFSAYTTLLMSFAHNLS